MVRVGLVGRVKVRGLVVMVSVRGFVEMVRVGSVAAKYAKKKSLQRSCVCVCMCVITDVDVSGCSVCLLESCVYFHCQS